MAAEAGAGAATSRFAAACGALSQYVRAADQRATRTTAAAAVRPLPLMPGADVVSDEREEAAAGVAQQLTIFYGGRVLVLDDCPADTAAALLRLAAAARGAAPSGAASASAAADLPVARKASLQRFMEKRKGRLAARGGAPYRRHDGDHLALAL
ncbi:protein TIFY 11e-like [Oryza brachyantha]|uniref:protein TIFY 11e-like n=1 Tax=Oryza brachyantha TaxID=4533 RepID=UPI001ADCFF38|nr:protein TIFY 11e-like [Oryza brachyantha]